jgi:hypothetical protein
MKFETKDLLSYDNFVNLLSNDSPNERAALICDKLK